MANKYALSSLFQSIASSDFPYDHPENAYQSGNATKVFIDGSVVDPEEQYIFDIFLHSLEIDPETVDNYGVATYENDVFTGHCPAFFGIRDGQMGIVIGSRNDKFGTSDTFVPCTVEREEVKRGKAKTWEYVYTVNGTPIVLEEKTDNKGVGQGKYFLTVQHVAVDEANDYREEYHFSLPFLIAKREFQKGEVEKLFYTGKFEECVREFGTGSSKIWLASNKAFTNLFREKSFPKGGVLLIATQGEYKITLAGSHPNITSDIHQTDWQIVASSHPELLVSYQNKDKQWDMCTLSEATNIQFSAAQVKNEGYTWLIKRISEAKGKLNPDLSIPAGLPAIETELIDRNLYTGYVLIHIVEPSSVKIENSPVNTVTDILDRALVKVKPYPHLMPSLQENAESFRQAALPTGGRAIARKPITRQVTPASTPAYTAEQEAEAYASMSMNSGYPVAPSTVPTNGKIADPLGDF